MLAEDALRKGLNLAEREGLETARALQAKVEPADAGEQGKDAQH